MTKKKTPDVVAPEVEEFGAPEAEVPKSDAPNAVPSVTSSSESAESQSLVVDVAGAESSAVVERPSIEELEASLAPKLSEPASVDVSEDSPIDDDEPASYRSGFVEALPELRKQIWNECLRMNKGNLSMGSLLVQKFKAVDVDLLNLEKFLKAHGYE